MRGNVFWASTPIAGVTIPVAPSTDRTTGTAGFLNPVGSGVNMSIIGIYLSSVTIRVAQRALSLRLQPTPTASNGGWPTGITRLPTYTLSGNRAARGYAYSLATINSGVVGTTGDPTSFGTFPFAWYIDGNINTAVGYVPVDNPLNFLVLGPDTVSTIVQSSATIGAINLTYVWSEWPVY